jgi:putative hydrolase of the HAD superfamily
VISTVVFDVGGTLLRTARPVGETYARLASNYGAALSPELTHQGFKRAWGKLKPRAPGTIPTNGDDRAWWKALVHEALADQSREDSFPFEDFFEEVYSYYERPEAWRVFPEVESVLQTLQAGGKRLVILSNWDKRLRTMLRELELQRYFSEIYISAELGWEKPEAALYGHVQQSMGLKASELLMVGDDPLNDYQAPRAQGWNSVWIERGKTDLNEVLEMLGQPGSD